LAPSGEQPLHLLRVGWDPQRGLAVATRPVHLVDQALHDPAGYLMNLDLVPELQEHNGRLLVATCSDEQAQTRFRARIREPDGAGEDSLAT
jgi:hypothetical protein